jgi:hypothetical protein
MWGIEVGLSDIVALSRPVDFIVIFRIKFLKICRWIRF